MPEDAMPCEHASIPVASVNTANRDGIVSEGFGYVRIRAMDGRAVAIEIEEALSGLTTVAVLDWGRPKRARTGLEADHICEAIQAASREDGIPVTMPAAH